MNSIELKNVTKRLKGNTVLDDISIITAKAIRQSTKNKITIIPAGIRTFDVV